MYIANSSQKDHNIVTVTMWYYALILDVNDSRLLYYILLLSGCTNQFVKLKYAPSSSTLSCQFLTPPDTSELRSCSVRYKKCQEEQSSPQTVSMKNVTANPIALKLSVSEGNSYCFVVTASNITFNVRIGGNISKSIKCFSFL